MGKNGSEKSKGKIDRPKPNAPWYIKLLVPIHIICITSYALPNKPERVANGLAKPYGSDWILVWNADYLKENPQIGAYLYVTGFWQYWDMFAPNPVQEDLWGDAEVTYKDGTVKRYAYPRMFNLPLPNRYVQERYRKFFERVIQEKWKYLWPQFALRIAYLCDDPKNPPVSVRLWKHWLRVMPPGKPQQTEYNKAMFFEYIVDPASLQRMREGRA